MAATQVELNNATDGTNQIEINKKTLNLSKCAVEGAMIACFLAWIAVIHYLTTTSFGYNIMGFHGQTIMSYVMGTNHNMDEFATEALFVVITRFVLVFCMTWLPITTILAKRKKFFE